jgi:hypothetical protein
LKILWALSSFSFKEQICEDSASFDFTSTDIASAIRELDSVASRLQELTSDEHLSAAFGMHTDKEGSDLELNDVLKVKCTIFSARPDSNCDIDIFFLVMLINLEAKLDGIELPNPNKGVTKPGTSVDFLNSLLYDFIISWISRFIFDLMSNSLITFETKTQVLELLNKITLYLANEGNF